MTESAQIENLVQQGETLLWRGQTEGFPVGYWLGFGFFTLFVIGLFVLPATYYLLTGDVLMNITLNGRPLTETQSSDVVSAIWSMFGLVLVFFVLIVLFTVHRLSRSYGVTDQNLIIQARFFFSNVRRLPLESVIQHSMTTRGDLITAKFQCLPSRSFVQKIYGVGEFCFHDFRDPDGHFPSIISAALAKARARQKPTEALS